MSPDEIKKYFERNPPPASVDWKPWIRITDTQKFMNSCFITLGSYKGNSESCPAWWHLREFYLDTVGGNLSAKHSQPATEAPDAGMA